MTGGRAFTQADTRLRIHRREKLEVEFVTPTCPSSRFEEFRREAAALHAALAASLPSTLAAHVIVESGLTETVAGGANRGDVSVRMRYVVARARGILLAIGPPLVEKASAAAWTGQADAAAISRALPVVLDASAAFSLVSHVLEIASGNGQGGKPLSVPGLTILETGDSPYPPHHVPTLLMGDARVQPSACWPDGRGSMTFHDDGSMSEFQLLTRPHRALSWLGPSSHSRRRNLRLHCARIAGHPSVALRIDAWTVRSSPHDGEAQFEALCSLVDQQRGPAHISSALPVTCDPWRLLESIRGACGQARPALKEDPIEGDDFGWAPPLLLEMTAGELLRTARHGD